MSSWIRGEYRFSRHIANIRIDLLLIHAIFGADLTALRSYNRREEDPTTIALYCAILLEIANGGQYRGADIWRLFQQPSSDSWYITICHAALPPIGEGKEIPILPLTMTLEEQCVLRDSLQALAERMACAPASPF